jgi:hypothetical protein
VVQNKLGMVCINKLTNAEVLFLLPLFKGKQKFLLNFLLNFDLNHTSYSLLAYVFTCTVSDSVLAVWNDKQIKCGGSV